MTTRIKVGGSPLAKIEEATVIVRLTPSELGVLFARMGVEEQAEALVAAAKEGKTWNGVAIIQWDTVGTHLIDNNEAAAISMCVHLAGKG